jgi:hypothetical protein
LKVPKLGFAIWSIASTGSSSSMITALSPFVHAPVPGRMDVVVL